MLGKGLADFLHLIRKLKLETMKTKVPDKLLWFMVAERSKREINIPISKVKAGLFELGFNFVFARVAHHVYDVQFH